MVSLEFFFIDIKSFRPHYGPGVDSASNRNDYQEYDDIFVNCNWVDTRWQQYSTHLHTKNTQNNTIKQNTHNGIYITYMTIRIHITISIHSIHNKKCM